MLFTIDGSRRPFTTGYDELLAMSRAPSPKLKPAPATNSWQPRQSVPQILFLRRQCVRLPCFVREVPPLRQSKVHYHHLHNGSQDLL